MLCEKCLFKASSLCERRRCGSSYNYLLYPKGKLERMLKERIPKAEYYLTISEEISKASKCLRSNFGAVIVKDDMIIGTGFNGPARGVKHCDLCKRANDPPGIGYEKCIAVHAEANAIIQAGGRKGCLGAIMYMGSHNRKYNGTKYNKKMGDFPCNNCGRLIINAGIEYLVQQENGEPKVYHIPTLVAESKLE